VFAIWQPLATNTRYTIVSQVLFQSVVVTILVDRYLTTCSTVVHDTCPSDSNPELKIQYCPNMTAVRNTQYDV